MTTVLPLNVDRQVSSNDRLSSGTAQSLRTRFSRSRKRPARTPPSTFLFLQIHLSNIPEPERFRRQTRSRIAPAETGAADTRHPSWPKLWPDDSPRKQWGFRGRAIAPGRRYVQEPLYSREPDGLSTDL